MPSSDRPDDETTQALTGDEMETVALRGDDDRNRPFRREPDLTDSATNPRYQPAPGRASHGPLREHTVPLGARPSQQVIHQVPVPALGPPPFEPPPFPPPPFHRGNTAALPPSAPAPPPAPSPLMASHVESLVTQAPDIDGRQSFAPISTFPPATVRARAAPLLERKTQGGTGRPPSWVVSYLLLCAALTLVGLIVLFFEHRMLGNAPPL